MRFGFPIPTRGVLGTLETIARLARAADEYQYDSIWITDHIVLPKTSLSKYPYAADGKLDLEAAQHYLEPLTVMSWSRRTLDLRDLDPDGVPTNLDGVAADPRRRMAHAVPGPEIELPRVA